MSEKGCPASLQGLAPHHLHLALHHLHHVRGLPCITCITSGACPESLQGHAPAAVHRGLPRITSGLAPTYLYMAVLKNNCDNYLGLLKMKSRRHALRRFAKKTRNRRKKISAQLASQDDRSRYVLWTLQMSMLMCPTLLRLCYKVICKVGLADPVDAVELFAGKQAVTKALARRCHKAVPFEIKKDPKTYDIMSGPGFLLAIVLVLSLNPFAGFLLAAPVCSSWTWINRATSRRSEAYPHGLDPREDVCAANKMVSRVVMLVRLAHALGALWIFEQPANSLLQLHWRVQELFSRCSDSMPIIVADAEVWRRHKQTNVAVRKQVLGTFRDMDKCGAAL